MCVCTHIKNVVRLRKCCPSHNPDLQNHEKPEVKESKGSYQERTSTSPFHVQNPRNTGGGTCRDQWLLLSPPPHHNTWNLPGIQRKPRKASSAQLTAIKSGSIFVPYFLLFAFRSCMDLSWCFCFCSPDAQLGVRMVACDLHPVDCQADLTHQPPHRPSSYSDVFSSFFIFTSPSFLSNRDLPEI